MKSKKTWVPLGVLGLGAVLILILAILGFQNVSATPPAKPKEAAPAAPVAKASAPAALTPPQEDAPPETSEKSKDPGRSPDERSAAAQKAINERIAKGLETARHLDVYRAEMLRKEVLDESREPALRTRDLLSLRQVNGVTPDVSESMIKVLRASNDWVTRERIVLGLQGDVTAAFRTEALRLLQTDPAPRVRQSAVKALLPMKSDSAVLEALKLAAGRDIDSDVRREIERTLSKPLAAPEKK